MQPYNGNMSIKIPYMRKGISSTLLVLLSTAMALVLLATPLILSNILFQPVQAQTTLSFRTVEPASGDDRCIDGPFSTLTFDAQGTTTSDSQSSKITNGTFKVTGGGEWYSGNIRSGVFGFVDKGLIIEGAVTNGSSTLYCSDLVGSQFKISADCSTFTNGASNTVFINTYFTFQRSSPPHSINNGNFEGAVECSTAGGNSATSITGTTTQDSDSDGDGIPYSSDKCPHNSEHRCFKEGDTSSTTTTSSSTQQEQ